MVIKFMRTRNPNCNSVACASQQGASDIFVVHFVHGGIAWWAVRRVPSCDMLWLGVVARVPVGENVHGRCSSRHN